MSSNEKLLEIEKKIDCILDYLQYSVDDVENTIKHLEDMKGIIQEKNN